MRAASTAGLAVVFALLCVGYVALTWLGEEEERRIEREERLFTFDAEDVEHIALRQGDAPPVEAVNGGERWAIEAPRADIPADNAAWRRVADTVAGLRRQREIGPATDLAKYGLDAPALTVTVSAAGARHVVAFGAMEPIQINRYARVDDGPVILINNSAYSQLNLPLDRLRDRRVFVAGREGVERVEFARIWNGRGEPPAGPLPDLGEELALVAADRSGPDGAWRVVAPKPAPAHGEKIQALLQEVLNAQGQHFVDAPESLADYGLDPPWARLTLLAAGSDTPQTLLLGQADLGEGREAGLFVKHADRGSVFVMEPYLLNHLPLSRTQFRDPHLLTRPIKGVQRLRYQSADTAFVLENDPEAGWILSEPERAEADQVAISTLIGQLVRMEVEDFVEGGLAEFGLDAPELRIELEFDDGAPARFLFATGEDGIAYATQDTGDIAVLPAEKTAALARGLDDFQSFELMRFNANDAVRVTFLFEGEQYQIQNLGGTWQLTMPSTMALQNQQDVKAILDAVNPVRAEAALKTDEPLSAYGLEPPAFSILVYVLDPSQEDALRRVGPLYVGAPVPGQSQRRYATAAGRSGVYIIHQAILDRIREAMHGIQPAPRR